MNALLLEFVNHFKTFVCLYLVYYFAHILWVKGRRWALAKYLIAGIMLFGATALEREWAALTRTFAPPGQEFNLWMDETRGIAYFLFIIPFTIGCYLYEAETREINNHPKMIAIYGGLVLFSAVIVWKPWMLP